MLELAFHQSISSLCAFSLAFGNYRGVWNVPYIANAYLIKADHLEELKESYSYNMKRDPDMSFCQFCREKVCSKLVDADGVPRLNAGLYSATEIFVRVGTSHSGPPSPLKA